MKDDPGCVFKAIALYKRETVLFSLLLWAKQAECKNIVAKLWKILLFAGANNGPHHI